MMLSIYVTPKECFEYYPDKSCNKRQKGQKKSSPGMDLKPTAVG